MSRDVTQLAVQSVTECATVIGFTFNTLDGKSSGFTMALNSPDIPEQEASHAVRARTHRIGYIIGKVKHERVALEFARWTNRRHRNGIRRSHRSNGIGRSINPGGISFGVRKNV